MNEARQNIKDVLNYFMLAYLHFAWEISRGFREKKEFISYFVSVFKLQWSISPLIRSAINSISIKITHQ